MGLLKTACMTSGAMAMSRSACLQYTAPTTTSCPPTSPRARPTVPRRHALNASLVLFHDCSLYNFNVGNFGAPYVSSNRCPFISILYCRFVVESPMRKMLYGSFRPPFPFGRCAMRLSSSARKSGLAPREISNFKRGITRESVSEPLESGSEALASGSELRASAALGGFGTPSPTQTNLYSALLSPAGSLLNIALWRSRE